MRYAFYRALEALERAAGAASPRSRPPARARPARRRSATPRPLAGISMGSWHRLPTPTSTRIPAAGMDDPPDPRPHRVRAARLPGLWCLVAVARADAGAAGERPRRRGRGLPERGGGGCGHPCRHPRPARRSDGRRGGADGGSRPGSAGTRPAGRAMPSTSASASGACRRTSRSTPSRSTRPLSCSIGRRRRRIGSSRLVFRAYGRLEAAVYGLPSSMADAGRTALEDAVSEVADAFGHVRLPSSVTDFEH